MRRARVVMVVLDAFPNHLVSPELTPTLWALATEGGRNIDGGISDLTAATYPNHAAFVTGRSTTELGIVTNRVFVNGSWQQSAITGPGQPTIFDACRAEGRSSLAAVGDQYLIGVCGAGAADAHWPPHGVLPDKAPRNAGGYAADQAVVAAIESMDVDVDFAFVHLDAVDAVRHLHGATGEEATEQCSLTDAALAQVLEPFRRRWDDTVVIVVSDHDQEDLSAADPVNLADHLGGQGSDDIWFSNQGTAAVVVGDCATQRLMAIPGVTGAQSLGLLRPPGAEAATRHTVVWGEQGQLFSSRATSLKGDHGSPRTQTQVALVSGGHETVPSMARWVTEQRPRSASWMPKICELLDLTWRP